MLKNEQITYYSVGLPNITCKKCKKEYEPQKSDISIKNPNYYYKNCSDCRSYFKQKTREFHERNKNKKYQRL